MPVYEYQCPRCHTEFELMRPMGEMNEPALCPECGSKAERLISVFASKVDYTLKVPEKPAFRKRPEEAADKVEGSR